MTKEGIRYILEGQADSFRALSRRNTEIFVEIEDDFFKGKSEAYKLAAEAFENIIRNYLPKEVDDAGNEN